MSRMSSLQFYKRSGESIQYVFGLKLIAHYLYTQNGNVYMPYLTSIKMINCKTILWQKNISYSSGQSINKIGIIRFSCGAVNTTICPIYQRLCSWEI